MNLISRDELPLVGMSIFFVTAAAGAAVRLHRNNYAVIIIVQEGSTACVIGEERREVHGGDITSIPARTPHSFVNIGDRPLRQIDVHASAQFVTEWLEEEP